MKATEELKGAKMLITVDQQKYLPRNFYRGANPLYFLFIEEE
uniref:Uncharacterized protein n=1 Tax=Roseihalotalea indica TaxID=2867963 RepID=A0AA49GNL8_9BACT|nr:hypothetical protein K4G66_00045 [Tunicatimonas sp. TK19036]